MMVTKFDDCSLNDKTYVPSLWAFKSALGEVVLLSTQNIPVTWRECSNILNTIFVLLEIPAQVKTGLIHI